MAQSRFGNHRPRSTRARDPERRFQDGHTTSSDPGPTAARLAPVGGEPATGALVARDADLVEEHLDTEALWRVIEAGAPRGLPVIGPGTLG